MVLHNIKQGRDELFMLMGACFKDKQVCVSLCNNMLIVKLMWIILRLYCTVPGGLRNTASSA